MKNQKNYSHRKVPSLFVKYVAVSFVFILVALFTIYLSLFSSRSPLLNEMTLEESFTIAENIDEHIFGGKKYVHLDLKGAPPLLSYYEYFFPFLKTLEVDGILLEYEDMFPYKGVLKNISALNAYTHTNIKRINMLAKVNELEIIPLVNVLDHLEFVLKLEEFKDLREVPEIPQTLCPSQKRSIKIMTEMVAQISEAHPNSTKLLVGAEESLYFGKCKHCVKKMKNEKLSQDLLYLSYIQTLNNFIRRTFPHISVLMWDDQLRYFFEGEKVNEMKTLHVTPVVRQFETDVFDKLGSDLWNSYYNIFPNVWIASAFKGATGADQYIVDIDHYTRNHQSWTKVIKGYKNLIKFEAIILTGWQRYDHFSILCELLPVSIPSLVINLKILTTRHGDVLGPSKEAADLLKCQQPYALMGTSFGTPKCTFLGSDILENVYRLHQLREDFEHLKKHTIVKGWMNAFNAFYNISSPSQVYHIASQLNHFKKEINEIKEQISKAILQVYDEYTKHEWICTYVEPLMKEIDALLATKTKILSKNVWPRRPFNRETFT